MGEIGVFDEDARLELLDGEVMEMAPIGSRHAGCVSRITQLLVRAVGESGLVSPQNPVELDKRSEPQPDLAVLRPRTDYYTTSHPIPDEILLVIEVADSSLAYDRDRKAPYYARSGIAECWIVDLTHDEVIVMNVPSPHGYRRVQVTHRGEMVEIAALAGVRLEVSDLLPPPYPA